MLEASNLQRVCFNVCQRCSTPSWFPHEGSYQAVSYSGDRSVRVNHVDRFSHQGSIDAEGQDRRQATPVGAGISLTRDRE